MMARFIGVAVALVVLFVLLPWIRAVYELPERNAEIARQLDEVQRGIARIERKIVEDKRP
jgi:Na+-transporting methylmalonyl-CoA/oxaloacetate decarboxylase gamma subunit